jgi:predicted RNase H-like HicB family nuclease
VEDEGGVYFALRIFELPGFLVAGRTEEEVLAESGDALETFLDSFLDRREPLPSPLWQVEVYDASQDHSPVHSSTELEAAEPRTGSVEDLRFSEQRA